MPKKHPISIVLLLVAVRLPAYSADPLLIVMNKHEDTMSFVNPRTLETVEKIPTGHDPHEIVITPDARFAYVSNYAPPGNTVTLIDLVHRRHVLQIPTGPYVRIHCAALSPDGRFAYFTAGQSGFVVEIDTRTNRVSRGIPTHGKISHMVEVSPDGRRLYTANIESQDVSVIDRESGKLITQVPCDAGCEGMAFTLDGKFLWAANQNAGNITIIDLATHKVKETMPCSGMPLRIRFTRDGRRALVSNWVAKGEVVVIDVENRREIERVPVGNQPIGLLITPDEDRLFVTSMSSDEVHVIDLARLEVTDRFVTGKGPDAMAWWVPPEGDESVRVQPRSGGSLFNGKDLTGFYTFVKDRGRDSDPRHVYSVVDGNIRISGEEWGYLATETEYENYHLTVEYRWGVKTWPPREDAARDNGILLHSIGEDGAYSGTWMYSIECQIIEGGTGDLLVVGDGTPKLRLTSPARPRDGGGYLFDPKASPVTLNGRGRIDWFGRDPEWKDLKGFRGRQDLEKPLGEWNRLDCIAYGDSIWYFVNGVLASQCHEVRPTKGKIQIQSESAEIFFRRVDLVPYSDPPMNAVRP